MDVISLYCNQLLLKSNVIVIKYITFNLFVAIQERWVYEDFSYYTLCIVFTI